MRVLVTGASGFVGRRLMPRLAAGGHAVTGADSEVEVSDEHAVCALVDRARPDAIVHLAAVSSVPRSRDDPGLTYRVNFLGTRSVLECARRHAPGARVLVVSSSEVYGAAGAGAAPLDERAPLRPRSPYARAKAAADLLAAGYGARGLHVVRARPFNHTGPGQSDDFVASSFARQVAEMEAGRRPPVMEVGNLDCVRDFLDVDDVIEAYVQLLDPDTPPGVYNVASGVGRPVREILDALVAGSGVQPDVKVDRGRVRPTDALVGDAGKLQRATGWAPRIPITDTLRRLLEHWRAALDAA